MSCSVPCWCIKSSERAQIVVLGRISVGREVKHIPKLCEDSSKNELLPFPRWNKSKVINLLLLINLQWHIDHQSPQFTLVFTHGVVHFMVWDKSTITCIHHFCNKQRIFTALKIFFAPPSHSHSPPNPGNYWSFHCLHSFAFSRISYSWGYLACKLFRLVFFT